MSGLRQRRLLLWGGGAVVVGVGAWLAFGFFGVHTLFVDDKIDEAAPAFASTVPSDGERADESNDGGGSGVAEEAVSLQGSFQDRSHPTSGTALVLTDGAQRVLRLEGFTTDNGPDLNVYLSPASPDADAGAFDNDYVDLGDLKGNLGDQNYDIPDEVDLEKYSTVVIWCVRFSVAFGTAGLV